ncbi:Group 7 allergen [Popillia japonica]|uniref:Group 7 allergen n=1 Tax=Popillia japonica TaxID=7064 RepID=A0AAW1N5N1_POPJA
MARLFVFAILALSLSFSSAAEIALARQRLSAAEIALAVEDIQEEYSITSISEATKIDVKTTLTVDSSVSKSLKSIIADSQTKVDVSFDINDQVDKILNQVSYSLLIESYDPVTLSDRNIEFTYKPLLVTYSGTLDLNKGQLQELSTVSRNGDAKLVHTLPENVLKVSIPLSYDTLIVSYDFTMSVKGDTVTGVLIGWATASVGEEISLTSTNFSLDIGSFDLDIYSASISSSYKNLVSSLTSDLLKYTVRVLAVLTRTWLAV